MRNPHFSFHITAGLYVLAVAVTSYFYYRPMSEPTPTIKHVILARDDCKSTEEAYLINRNWEQVGDKFRKSTNEDPNMLWSRNDAVDIQAASDAAEKAKKKKSRNGS